MPRKIIKYYDFMLSVMRVMVSAYPDYRLNLHCVLQLRYTMRFTLRYSLRFMSSSEQYLSRRPKH